MIKYTIQVSENGKDIGYPAYIESKRFLHGDESEIVETFKALGALSEPEDEYMKKFKQHIHSQLKEG